MLVVAGSPLDCQLLSCGEVVEYFQVPETRLGNRLLKLSVKAFSHGLPGSM